MKRVMWASATVVAFVSGLFIGYKVHPFRSLQDLHGVEGTERSRVTDPSGRLDAVILRELYGGAAGGGINWYACIVQKGHPALAAKEAVFMATSASDVKLSWRQPHLLEIRYQKAMVLAFENLWSTNRLGTKWFSSEEPYWIEIRLGPSSPDFSVLTPSGDFQ